VVDHHVHLEKGPYGPHDYPLAWLERYVETAQARGVDTLGVVEHAYRFVEARGLLPGEWAEARCRYRLGPYLEFVERARAAGQPILAGLEMDYVPGHEEGIARFLALYPWDFVLGSVHWLGDFAVDNSPDDWRGRDVDAVWERYVETAVGACESGLFDVFTHPDLPKLWGHMYGKDLSRLYAPLVEALARAGMAIEVNTNGLRRPVGILYPAPEILVMARRRGVAATVASDAHEPEFAGFAFDRAVALMRSAGYDRVARIERRTRRLEALAPSMGA
jgi:histidinol-phosphatase (PHP family)